MTIWTYRAEDEVLLVLDPHSDACDERPIRRAIHSFVARSLSAFVITETELKLIAAAAIMGLSNNPKNGYRTPAARGTPSAL